MSHCSGLYPTDFVPADPLGRRGARGAHARGSRLVSHRDDVREDAVSMASARHEQARERRHVADRRARPPALAPPLAWRQRLEAGPMAGEAHDTLDHTETRRNPAMVATLRLILEAESPVGCAAPWRGVSSCR
jgi:hypothetical protein